MKFTIIYLLITYLCVNGESQAPAQSEKNIIQTQNQIDRKPKLIVCYYAQWKHKSIAGNPCTHIIYAFVGVHENGSFSEINQNQRGKFRYCLN